MGELIPAGQPEEEKKDLWPTKYWPDDATKVKYDDEKLRDIVQELADTNDTLKLICQRNGVPMAAITRIRNKIPDFNLAIELAKAHRNERLNDEILEIADAPVLADDLELAKFDLQHRKLKIAAREKVMKGTGGNQKKGIDKFTVNIDGGEGEGASTVNIQIVNYGDAK